MIYCYTHNLALLQNLKSILCKIAHQKNIHNINSSVLICSLAASSSRPAGEVMQSKFSFQCFLSLFSGEIATWISLDSSVFLAAAMLHRDSLQTQLNGRFFFILSKKTIFSSIFLNTWILPLPILKSVQPSFGIPAH